MAQSQTSGPTASTQVGELVAIEAPGEGPFGMSLDPGPDGFAAVITQWERLPDGKFGPVQRHGGVRLGDVLFAINTTTFEKTPFRDVLTMLRDRNMLRKTLKFCSMSEFLRRKAGASMLGGANSGKAFSSVIKRGRVNMETGTHFAEYEVACQLRMVSMKVQKEKVYRWTVWKRYSEFERLDAALRRTLGWQLENIAFPPSHTFVFNKLALDFVEQRRDELNTYWQSVLQIDRIAEFTKHHCSEDLKIFLDVDQALTSDRAVPDGPDEEVAGAAEPKDAETKKKSGAKRQSVNRSRRSLAAHKKSSSSASLKAPLTFSTATNGDATSSPPSSDTAHSTMAPVPENGEAASSPPVPPPVPAAAGAAKIAHPSPSSSPGRAGLLAQINARRLD